MLSLQNASIFMAWFIHDLKLAADQGFADALNNYGICLRKG
jgi:hypothetical protein